MGAKQLAALKAEARSHACTLAADYGNWERAPSGPLTACGEPVIAILITICVHEHIDRALLCMTCAAEIQRVADCMVCPRCQDGPRPHDCLVTVKIGWLGEEGRPVMTMADGQCGSCRHKEHRGRCTRRASSRCTPLDTGGGSTGFACGPRPPCPCPWRTCRCGTLVAVAACADDPGYEETIERGSAADPAGTLAVRLLADSTLMARPLTAETPLKPGEWQATDHDARCPKASARGVVDVTDAAGSRIPAGEVA